MSSILPVHHSAQPKFVEARAIYLGDDPDRASCGMNPLVQPSSPFLQKQGDFFHFNSIIPSQGNRTGERIMLEVDNVSRQAITGDPVFYFVLLVYGEGFGLSSNELAQPSG